MLIDLSALGGRSKQVEISVGADDLDLALEHARLTAPAQFSGEVSGDDFRANVRGRIDSNFELDCTRCLEPVKISLPIEFSSEFVAKEHFGSEGEHEIDPENLTANSLDGDRIDLTEVVREQILLNLPEQMYCRDDCKGICESCGVNRNLSDCGCEADEADPRWAALKNLK